MIQIHDKLPAWYRKEPAEVVEISSTNISKVHRPTCKSSKGVWFGDQRTCF